MKFITFIFCNILVLATFSQTVSNSERLKLIDTEITTAVEKEDYQTAATLKKEKEIRLQIKEAVAIGDYEEAGRLKKSLASSSGNNKEKTINKKEKPEGEKSKASKFFENSVSKVKSIRIGKGKNASSNDELDVSNNPKEEKKSTKKTNSKKDFSEQNTAETASNGSQKKEEKKQVKEIIIKTEEKVVSSNSTRTTTTEQSESATVENEPIISNEESKEDDIVYLNNSESALENKNSATQIDPDEIHYLEEDEKEGWEENKRKLAYEEMKGLFDFEVQNQQLSEKAEKYIQKETANFHKLKEVDIGLKDVTYRRSSVYSMMINDSRREFYAEILNAFGNNELSEKYDDHNIGPYLIDAAAAQDNQLLAINRYLKENDVAKKMVAKWFNRSPKGGFNMARVAERGQYNANELDVAWAQQNARGLILLSDAGEELIGNTFFVVHDFKYTDIGKTNKKIDNFLSAISISDEPSFLEEVIAESGIDLDKAYVIKSQSYLFQLQWNDSIASVFYKNYWTTDEKLNKEKVESFLESDLFSLKYIGTQKVRSYVESYKFQNFSDEKVIGIATVRAVNKAFGKLQQEFEGFSLKTPLMTVNPLTASIGLKEGLNKKAKFEVLEQEVGKDGKTFYKRKAILTVEKGNIWDNRYMASEIAAKKNKQMDLGRTILSGNENNLYPGMLIRQIK